MKNYRKHIDDFFREKLGKYTETPPGDVWDDLEKRLDILDPPAPGNPFRWGWHIAMVSLIVLLSIPFVRSLSGNAHTDAANSTAANSPASKPENSNDQQATGNTAGSDNIKETIPAQQAAGSDNVIADPKQDAVASAANKPTEQATTQNTGSRSYSTNSAQRNTRRHAISKATGRHKSAIQRFTAPAQHEEANTYNAGSATAAKEVETFENKVSPAVGDVAGAVQPLPAAFKKEEKKDAPVAAAEKKNDAEFRNNFKRFEAGIKGGYERGFDNNAATKIFVAPYLQYNLSSKLSLVLQPSVKAATVSNKTIASQSYYKTNHDGSSTAIHADTSRLGSTTVYNTTYQYTETHDSVVKSYTYGGTYVEFELPVLIKYNIGAKVAVYGGANILYNRSLGITENTYEQKAIAKTSQTTVRSVDVPPAPPAPATFDYSGKSISSYAGPLSPNQGSQLRIGYMLGFSYEYSPKWLFDAAVQQSPVKTDVKGDYNINAPFSSTYFRLSVGYKLTRP
jgi:hypothetical protein